MRVSDSFLEEEIALCRRHTIEYGAKSKISISAGMMDLICKELTERRQKEKQENEQRVENTSQDVEPISWLEVDALKCQQREGNRVERTPVRVSMSALSSEKGALLSVIRTERG